MSILSTSAGQRTSAPRIACDNAQLSTGKTLSSAERLAGFRAQFRYFYGQECGYFAIDAGIADDKASTGILMLIPTDERPDTPNERQWCYYDPERPDLLQTAAELALERAEKYGNVYLTRTLFARKRATKDSAKPSHIIAVEDAPQALPLPASRVLRTSPGSRQAFYKLSEPVSTARAEKLSKLIARTLKADRSGTNANKVLRLVGGLNTKKKYGAPFLVSVESRGPDYTYDELWQAYSALLTPEALAEVEAQSQRDRAVIRWPEPKEQWLEHWRKHIDVLMDGRMPRVFKLATWSQGYKIFGDDKYIAGWKHESGSWDASTVRHVRAANLVRAGCTDEMAAAMLEAAEYPETIRIKGLNAVRNDIKDRVTTARETEHNKQGLSGYNLVGSFARKRQPEYELRAEGQLEEARSGGRPATLTAETLLAFYHERATGAVVAMTRAEVAETLHVSPATIYRLNSELKTRGEIAVEHAAGRQRSEIRLLRLVKTSDENAPEMTRSDETINRIATPQIELHESAPTRIVTHLGLSPTLGTVATRELASPEPDPPILLPSTPPEEEQEGVRFSQTTPAAPKTIREAVALEVAERTAEKRNPKTGALYRGRAPFKAVFEAVKLQFPEALEHNIRHWYERLMTPIRREMAQESRRLTVMGYFDDVLYNKLKSARGLLSAAGRPKPAQRPEERAEKHAERVAKWDKIHSLEWKYRQDVERFTAELERRGLPLEPPARQRLRHELANHTVVITAVPTQDELFTRLAAEPLPTNSKALWDMLESLSAARGVPMTTETLTPEELAERVERLRSVAISA